jgi:hypothetical protein
VPQHPAECLGLIEARQDDLDLRRRRTDHAPTLRSIRHRWAEANRFRLAYALEHVCPRCSRRNTFCLG